MTALTKTGCRALVVALALLGALAPPALGTPQQVLEDYNLDGRIDGSHTVHDLRGALLLPAPGSQYGSFADAVQAKLTEELAGSEPQPPATVGAPQEAGPQYGATPAQPRPTPPQAAPSTPTRGAAPTPGRPSPLPSPSPQAEQPSTPPAPAAPRPQRLVNSIEDLGSEVLAPAVVVPPRLATFPSPPAPSPQQRLPWSFVPLAALAGGLLLVGILSGLWRSLRPGTGRRAVRRRVETLRLGD